MRAVTCVLLLFLAGTIHSTSARGATIDILTLGDSIMSGDGSTVSDQATGAALSSATAANPASIRKGLGTRLAQANVDYRFVGTHWNNMSRSGQLGGAGVFPSTPLNSNVDFHNGMPGEKVGQLQSRLNQTASTANGTPGGLALTSGTGGTPEKTYAALHSLGQTPEVVLLMVGTNDANSASPIDTAALFPATNNGYRRLLNELFAALPDVHVVVSTLLPILNPVGSALTQEMLNVLAFNDALTNFVASYSPTNGGSISLIDVETVLGPSLVAPGYLGANPYYSDEFHPNDLGYDRLAQAWFEGLIDAGIVPSPMPEPSTASLLLALSVLTIRARTR